MREYPTLPSFGLRRHKAHKHKLFGGCINFYANTASFARMMIAYWHLFCFAIPRIGLYTIAIHYRLILEPHGYRFPPQTQRLNCYSRALLSKVRTLREKKKPASTWMKVCFPHRCPMSFIARGSFNQTHLPVLYMAR